MGKDLNKISRSIANSSGFPLQIRIAHDANSTSNWEVFLEEHPWHSNETGSEGFIDLVVRDQNHAVQAMVIECKRVRDTAWVFLIPKVKQTKDPRIERSHVRLWFSSHCHVKWNEFGWSDCQANPFTYESKFCAIQGQESGRRNLLERTAFDLIESVEALAWQERKLQEGNGGNLFLFERRYTPVIITTAELRVSFFDPSSISSHDGTLPNDTSFEVVPYIRFRKSLTSNFGSSIGKSIQEAYQTSERTVFVVNSESWIDFLEKWEIRR